MNRALAILALVGAAAVIAGNRIHHHHDWGYALVLFGGMLMGFCLGFYLAARTVRETFGQFDQPVERPKLKVVKK